MDKRLDISVRVPTGRIRIKDVARLDVKPGDTLCFWFEDMPRDASGDPLDVAALLKDQLPEGVKVWTFEGNVGVGILSPADVELLTHPQKVVVDCHVDGEQIAHLERDVRRRAGGSR